MMMKLNYDHFYKSNEFLIFDRCYYPYVNHFFIILVDMRLYFFSITKKFTVKQIFPNYLYNLGLYVFYILFNSQVKITKIIFPNNIFNKTYYRGCLCRFFECNLDADHFGPTIETQKLLCQKNNV